MAKVEKGRFAVIIKETGEVSEIKRFEGGKTPEVGHPELYDVVEVGPDVKIGMVRDGDTFAFNVARLQAAAPATDEQTDGHSQDGVGNPNATVTGDGIHAPVTLQSLDDKALRAFIKERTGTAPKGNPSRETLLRLAAEADQKAAG
jgi:hypothetical protein